MEFYASAKLLKTELDSTTIESTKFRQLSKTETPRLPNTSQRLTSYGYWKMAMLLNSGKSGQTRPSGINQDFGEILS
jgi:hypothetical protein